MNRVGLTVFLRHSDRRDYSVHHDRRTGRWNLDFIALDYRRLCGAGLRGFVVGRKDTR